MANKKKSDDDNVLFLKILALLLLPFIGLGTSLGIVLAIKDIIIALIEK